MQTISANEEQQVSSSKQKFVPALSEDDATNYAQWLRALADPIRLRILSLLLQREGLLCVLEIVECFPREQPTISHHLRILRDARLVDVHKKGLWSFYYIRKQRFLDVQKFLASFIGAAQ